MYYIGIDLGTSAVKLILCDKEMNILKTIFKEYPLDFTSSGKSEQNSEDWWNKTLEGIKELKKEFHDIAGIGVAGQMHGLVMLDEFDNVIRPAILWNDTRSSYQSDKLNTTLGLNKLQKLTGNMSFPGFTASKLLWVQKNDKKSFEKCKKICLPASYINYKLTGNFTIDVSDASGTLFFDVQNRCWQKEMLKICNITEDMLPVVHESNDIIGNVKEELGIGKNVVVVAGAGDNAAAAIGTNTIKEGQCNISLGTSGTVFIPTNEYVKQKNPVLHSFCHANNKYHLMGCILSAASANKWLTETILKNNKYDIIDNLKFDNNIYFMPYLSGERCPYNDADIRGAFLGLSHDTTRNDLNIALLEGISFAIKDCLNLANKNITKATVCGGGTKSKEWMIILANVLGIELEIITSVGPALGAAMLVANKTKENETLETIKPQKEIIEIYKKKYKKYKKLYPMVKDFYKN